MRVADIAIFNPEQMKTNTFNKLVQMGFSQKDIARLLKHHEMHFVRVFGRHKHNWRLARGVDLLIKEDHWMHSFKGTSKNSGECLICGEEKDEHWDHLEAPDKDDIKELKDQQKEIDKENRK